MSATPILDLERDPPAVPAQSSRLAKRLISLGVGGAIGWGLASSRYSLPAFDFLPGFNFLFFLIGTYAGITLHELGHLAVGKLRGMDPGALIVGGFRLMKSGERWTCRVEWRQFILGGMAMPLATKESSVEDFVWMVAAGPLISVVWTLLCWSAFLRFGTGTGDWIGSLFWGSLLSLFSLIPMSAGMHKSDAARVWMLLKHPDQALAWMAAVSVQSENVRGLKPREWDAALIKQMLSAPQPGAGRIFPELMGYYRSLDKADQDAACGHLENALAASAKAGKVVRQLLFFEAAEVNALIRGNAVHARLWLDRGLKLRKPESKACVESGVAISEGRFEDALRDIAATRAFIAKRKLDSGLIRFAKERLDQRERLCEENTRALAAGN